MDDLNDAPDTMKLNLDREREADDPLRVLVVADVEAPFDLEQNIEKTAVTIFGVPQDRDTTETFWRFLGRADVVVGRVAETMTHDQVAFTSAAIAVAASWRKYAIMCVEPNASLDESQVGNVLVLTPAETLSFLRQLAGIAWHAPDMNRWGETLNAIETRLQQTPHAERIAGGPFCGLPAYEVLETIAACMRGQADTLTVLGALTDAIAVPENVGERTARRFAIAQADEGHWFRWPDGFLEWSKKAIVGLRRTEHPTGYFDRALRDVRGWDLARVAELLRLRARYIDERGEPGGIVVAAELRLLADVIELALPVGTHGEIDPAKVASIGIVRRSDVPKYGPGAR